MTAESNIAEQLAAQKQSKKSRRSRESRWRLSATLALCARPPASMRTLARGYYVELRRGAWRCILKLSKTAAAAAPRSSSASVSASASKTLGISGNCDTSREPAVFASDY